MIKKIEGRFRHIDESVLEQMSLDLRMLLKAWGAVGPEIAKDARLPLWAEVEFLANIVQFELAHERFRGSRY